MWPATQACAIVFCVAAESLLLTYGCFACIPDGRIFHERDITACVAMMVLGGTFLGGLCAALMGACVGAPIDCALGLV